MRGNEQPVKEWLDETAPDNEEAGMILAQMTIDLEPLPERLKVALYILTKPKTEPKPKPKPKS